MRLNAQLYLFGLLQFVLVAGALFGVVLLMDPKDETRERGQIQAALTAIGDATSVESVHQVVERFSKRGVRMRVRQGKAIVATSVPSEKRCKSPSLETLFRELRAPSPPPGPDNGARPPPPPPPGKMFPPKFFAGGDAPAHCYRYRINLVIDDVKTPVHLELHPDPPRAPPLGILLLSTTLLLLLVTSFLFGRRLAGPLRTLANAASALGEGDLQTRVSTNRSDEIGDVARAFNHMASQVDQLLKAEKELLATVSHELRTPLARLRLGLDLAAAEPTPDAIAELEVDVLELTSLVEHLLFAAQLEAGHRDYSVLPMAQQQVRSMTVLVSEAVETFGRQSQSRPVEIRVDEDAEEASVLVDAGLVQKALLNLLDNGHKYSPDSTAPLVVHVSSDHDRVRATVEDRGIGFESSDDASHFRPFVRGREVTKRGIKGVGLGLSLVRHIAQQHGGDVELSNREGGGAAVTLVLPATKDEASPRES